MWNRACSCALSHQKVTNLSGFLALETLDFGVRILTFFLVNLQAAIAPAQFPLPVFSFSVQGCQAVFCRKTCAVFLHKKIFEIIWQSSKRSNRKVLESIWKRSKRSNKKVLEIIWQSSKRSNKKVLDVVWKSSERSNKKVLEIIWQSSKRSNKKVLDVVWKSSERSNKKVSTLTLSHPPHPRTPTPPPETPERQPHRIFHTQASRRCPHWRYHTPPTPPP